MRTYRTNTISQYLQDENEKIINKICVNSLNFN